MEVELSSRIKLSAQQTDIFLDQFIHKDIPLYNIGGYVEFVGDVDVDILLKAHRLMVTHAEAFSTRLGTDSESFYMVCDAQPGEAKTHDVSMADDPILAARLTIDELYKTNFDFAQTMFVSGLIKLTDQKYWYYGIAHHLIMDGWGFSNWVQSLCKLYNELSEGVQPSINFPSFKSLVEKENEYLDSSRKNKDQAFWKTTFNSIPKLLLTPQYKHKLSPQEQFKSKRVSSLLDYKTFESHQAYAASMGASVVQLYLGAMYIYFSRVYSQKELVFSLPVHNRRTADAKKTIGTALSVYPTQISAEPDMTVSELIAYISKRQKLEFRHQRYPMGQLHNDLELRKRNQPRLFDISFNYQKLDYAVSVNGLNTSTYFLTNGYEQTPLTFTVCDFGAHQPAELQIDFNQSYFDSDKAQAMLKRWSYIVEQMVASSDSKIAELQLTSRDEQALLRQINSTQTQWPNEHYIAQFEQQVDKSPAAIALRFEDEMYSYEQLDNKVNQYAHLLYQQGVRAHDMVGVCLPRQAELVIALLAVMKLGATYVPMDPSFPIARLAHMLEYSEQNILITSERLATELTRLEVKRVLPACILLDQLQIEASAMPTCRMDSELSGEDRAYVLFTSGSTGVPKGVSVSHASLLNFLMSMAHKPGFTAEDRLLAVTTISFDIAGLELYLPLFCGGTLVLASSTTARNGKKLLNAISQYEVTTVQATPATWQLLIEAGWSSSLPVKALCGGEALTATLAEQLLSRAKQVWNLYGPTETTIWSTVSLVLDKDDINLGKPIDNTQIYLLDEHYQQVPYGEKGRLFIGGKGVAQGYLNDPNQTQAKFINWCNLDGVNERIYDTGDFASFGQNGNLYYHGRTDNQIKFSGYRIELGDIESALNGFAGIEDSIVKIQRDDTSGTTNANGRDFLVAYYVSSTSINIDELKRFLGTQLPSYMMPLVYVAVDEFSLTPNGKKDRNALRKAARPQHKVEGSALPSSEMEKIIVSVWQEVLSQEHISVEQNLFEIGAASIDVVRAGNKLEQRLSRSLDTVNLFEHTTVRALAKYLTGDKPDAPELDKSEQMQAGKKRMMQRRMRR